MRRADRRVLAGLAAAVAAGALALVGFRRTYFEASDRREAEWVTGGSVERGRAAVRRYGCGACHTIPRVSGANALVGPPLAGVGRRVYLGGVITNTPENMMRWIQDPQRIDSMTAMPRLGVTPADAKDIAAFLYSLR